MRKDRHLLRQSWKRLRAEIETVRSLKRIDPSDFRSFGINEDWETIESKIHHTFCDLPLPTSKPNWLWTYFKTDTAVFSNLVNNSYQFIDQLIDPTEKIWFFVNETVNEKTKFWFYEGYLNPIITIIEEIYFDEFYLVSKKYDWLICYNHHDQLIATGKLIPDRLRKLKEKIDSLK